MKPLFYKNVLQIISGHGRSFEVTILANTMGDAASQARVMFPRASKILPLKQIEGKKIINQYSLF